MQIYKYLKNVLLRFILGNIMFLNDSTRPKSNTMKYNYHEFEKKERQCGNDGFVNQ